MLCRHTLAPAVIQIGIDAFPAAQFSDGNFTPESLQDDTDLLLSGMLSTCFTTDILNRLFSVGYAHIETPLHQLNVAELSLSESGQLVTQALTAHSLKEIFRIKWV
jgi:hypothetical protein